MMLPHIVAALLLAYPGIDGARVGARVACDTIRTPRVDGTGLVYTVAVGDRGRVAWTDIGDPRKVPNVYVRDERGRTHVVGRKGAGPGEIRTALLSWSGDTLWVADRMQARIQAFSDTGKFLTVRRVPTVDAFAVGPRGALFGWVLVHPVPFPKTGIPSYSTPRAVIAIHLPKEKQDTLAVFPFVPFQHPNETPVQWTQTGSSSDQRFWCAMGNAATPGLRLLCVDETGKKYLNGVFRLAPRPVTDAIWNSKANYVLSGGGQFVSALVNERAPTLPRGFDLMINRNGDVWILRSYPSEPMLIWDRLDRTGKALPSVTVPNRHQLRALDGASYYAADTDDDGLQTLIRCTIQ